MNSYTLEQNDHGHAIRYRLSTLNTLNGIEITMTSDHAHQYRLILSDETHITALWLELSTTFLNKAPADVLPGLFAPQTLHFSIPRLPVYWRPENCEHTSRWLSSPAHLRQKRWFAVRKQGEQLLGIEQQLIGRDIHETRVKLGPHGRCSMTRERSFAQLRRLMHLRWTLSGQTQADFPLSIHEQNADVPF